MDANRFDALARQIAQPFRRRSLLGVAAALLATSGRYRPATAGKNCCGSTWDCGDCACTCMPDGSFQGCCCGALCPSALGNADGCCQANTPTCCGGACCGVGEVCRAPGICGADCPADTTKCGVYCCHADRVCVEDGVCGAHCKPGAEQCGKRCCEFGCSGNDCAPPPPPPPPPPCTGTMCNGQCCDAGIGCDLTGLACAVPCKDGLLPCHGTCILPCAKNRVLNADTCTCECPGTTAPCGEGCANLQTDERHCGRCGKRCRRGQRCRGGKCR